MESESLSLWACLTSWFTPTTLFLLLNLVIGTIALTSKQKTPKSPHPSAKPDGSGDGTPLSRSSSMLQRLRSFNLYNTYQPQEDELTTTTNSCQTAPAAQGIRRQPSFLERVRSFGSHTAEIEDDDDHDRKPSLIQRLRSFKPCPDESTSSDSDSDEVAGPGGPATWEECNSPIVRSRSDSHHLKSRGGKKSKNVLRKTASAAEASEEEEEEGGEVDARADDFINRFRQQLKLQRLDSILRYSEMLKRGSG